MRRFAPLALLLTATALWAGPPGGLQRGSSTDGEALGAGLDGIRQEPLRRGQSPVLGSASNTSRAGSDKVASFRVEDITRWQRVKQRLSELMAAYTSRDAHGFMRAVSGDYEQDPVVLRNALLVDFQEEANFSVDIELLTYQVTFSTVNVELRWNRIALDGSTGVTLPVATGQARVLFDRVGGLKMKSWLGPAPFGIRDPQFQAQIAAGQPNLTELETFSINLTVPDNDDFQAVIVDFEARRVRLGFQSGFQDSDISPTEDLAVNGDDGQMTAGDARQLKSLPDSQDAGVVHCGNGAAALSSFREVTGALHPIVNFPETNVFFLGGRTQEGNYYVTRVAGVSQDAPDGSTPIEISWILRRDGSPLLSAAGSIDCH